MRDGMGSGEWRALDERLARGEIGTDDYLRQRAALRAEGPRQVSRRWPGGRTAIIATAIAAAAVALAAVATVATMAAGPGSWRAPWSASRADCAAPALPGHVVDVTLADMMGGMMGTGPQGAGPMRVVASRASVPAGTVSLLVTNRGALTHELVVLPLTAGQRQGSRPVDQDGTVSEAGSVGEASATCGAGHGDGIAPGTRGWVTLRLTPGRYELICNIPGHYAKGMHAELDVRLSSRASTGDLARGRPAS